MEGLGHHPAMSSAGANQVVVLGDRHRDPGDVGLLKGVRADHLPSDLAGDRDHGNGVHLRVGQRGDQIGGARPRCGHADPHPAGAWRIRWRRGRPLLVAHEHCDAAVASRTADRRRAGPHRRGYRRSPRRRVLQRPDNSLCTGKTLRCNASGLDCLMLGAVVGLRWRRPLRWLVVGALTRVPFVLDGEVDSSRVMGKKKPSSAWLLHEGARR